MSFLNRRADGPLPSRPSGSIITSTADCVPCCEVAVDAVFAIVGRRFDPEFADRVSFSPRDAHGSARCQCYRGRWSGCLDPTETDPRYSRLTGGIATERFAHRWLCCVCQSVAVERSKAYGCVGPLVLSNTPVSVGGVLTARGVTDERLSPSRRLTLPVVLLTAQREP